MIFQRYRKPLSELQYVVWLFLVAGIGVERDGCTAVLCLAGEKLNDMI